MTATADEGGRGGTFGMGAVFLLAGLALGIGWFGSAFLASVEARGWPTHPGEVLVSEVGVTGDDQEHVKPIVVYAYRVQGREYLSARHSLFVVHDFSQSSARTFLQRYPVGRKVACFVDPLDPRRSVIDPRWLFLSLANASVAGFSALFGTAGLGMLYSAFQQRRASAFQG
jgi:hypothetical protein